MRTFQRNKDLFLPVFHQRLTIQRRCQSRVSHAYSASTLLSKYTQPITASESLFFVPVACLFCNYRSHTEPSKGDVEVFSTIDRNQRGYEIRNKTKISQPEGFLILRLNNFLE